MRNTNLEHRVALGLQIVDRCSSRRVGIGDDRFLARILESGRCVIAPDEGVQDGGRRELLIDLEARTELAARDVPRAVVVAQPRFDRQGRTRRPHVLDVSRRLRAAL